MQLTDFNLTINRDKIINVIIILVTLLIVIKIFQSQADNIELLKGRKDEEVKKNEVLNDINQSEKMFNSYKDALDKNKKDISLVLNTINNIAYESAVRINSIKPNKEEDYPYYIKYPFDLIIAANNYHSIGKFISNLESHSDVYFVDRLSIKSEKKYTQHGRVQEESEQIYNLTATLTLATIVVKD